MTTTTSSARRPHQIKPPLLTRFFNVLHYGTVAVLVGSTVFLAINVVGAAQAKKKSFREEQVQARLLIEQEQENGTDKKESN